MVYSAAQHRSAVRQQNSDTKTDPHVAHPLLIGITYSPWSYKARWALDWHGINYRYQEYLLMLGQVKLRAQLRQRAHATVPAMISADTKLRDSFEIAKWADQQQGGTDLQTNTAEVAQWNQISESILRLGRIRCALSVQDDPAGLRASVPPPMNKLPGATQLAKLGVRYILKTYPINTQVSEIEKQCATHLATVESGLSEQDFLLGTPS
ncbi:MAG TPA: hypothetical protein EYN66_14020, partial [Myxococcales bacterium]|nr:hypothetical protein [Myxococcales bacterium]